MGPNVKHILGYRMKWSDPRQVRQVMIILWSVFVFGSCVVAGGRFALTSATFDEAFGNLPGSIIGFTIGTGIIIGASYLTKKTGPGPKPGD